VFLKILLGKGRFLVDFFDDLPVSSTITTFVPGFATRNHLGDGACPVVEEVHAADVKDMSSRNGISCVTIRAHVHGASARSRLKSAAVSFTTAVVAHRQRFLCIRSTPTEMQSMRENDFECSASTGAKTPQNGQDDELLAIREPSCKVLARGFNN